MATLVAVTVSAGQDITIGDHNSIVIDLSTLNTSKIEKSGDSGIGNLSMQELTATKVTVSTGDVVISSGALKMGASTVIDANRVATLAQLVTQDDQSKYTILGRYSGSVPESYVRPSAGSTGIYITDTSGANYRFSFLDGGQLRLDTNATTNAGGIKFYTDTYLYRNGVNSLKTDGKFIATRLAAGTDITYTSGDVSANRGDGSGVIYLGDSSHYLFWPGTGSYSMPNAGLALGGGITIPDSNGYALNLYGYNTWGIYWNTTDNRFEFHGGGTNRASIDLDDGSIVCGPVTSSGVSSFAGGNIYTNAFNTIAGASTGHIEGPTGGSVAMSIKGAETTKLIGISQSTGNVLVGTTTDASYAGKLQVNGAVTNGSYSGFQEVSSSTYLLSNAIYSSGWRRRNTTGTGKASIFEMNYWNGTASIYMSADSDSPITAGSGINWVQKYSFADGALSVYGANASVVLRGGLSYYPQIAFYGSNAPNNAEVQVGSLVAYAPSQMLYQFNTHRFRTTNGVDMGMWSAQGIELSTTVLGPAPAYTPYTYTYAMFHQVQPDTTGANTTVNVSRNAFYGTPYWYRRNNGEVATLFEMNNAGWNFYKSSNNVDAVLTWTKLASVDLSGVLTASGFVGGDSTFSGILTFTRASSIPIKADVPFQFLTTGNAAQSIYAGGLVVSNSYSDSAPSMGIYSKGDVQVDGVVRVKSGALWLKRDYGGGGTPSRRNWGIHTESNDNGDLMFVESAAWNTDPTVARVQVKSGGNLNLLTGALEIAGTPVLSNSRHIYNIQSITCGDVNCSYGGWSDPDPGVGYALKASGMLIASDIIRSNKALYVNTTVASDAHTAMISMMTPYHSGGAQKAIVWRDASTTTGQIDTRYDGTYVKMVFGHLYQSGYQTDDIMAISNEGVDVAKQFSAGTLQTKVAFTTASTYSLSSNPNAGLLCCDTSSNNCTVTLPAPSAALLGRTYRIAKASALNAITLQVSGGSYMYIVNAATGASVYASSVTTGDTYWTAGNGTTTALAICITTAADTYRWMLVAGA